MGWCSGTDLFDEVLDVIFALRVKDTVALVKSVKTVIKAFESNDADCLMETKHSDSSIFVQAWVNLYPDYYWDHIDKCLRQKDDD